MIGIHDLVGIWWPAALMALAPLHGGDGGPPSWEAQGLHRPAAAAALSDAAARSQTLPVRIWSDEGVDLFYPGDRVDLRFRSAEDAYVAVVHLDTEGNLALLLPTADWTGELVRGQRTYSLPGASGRFTLGRTAGIGYFFIIASAYPLDLRHFRATTPRSGMVVRGDPFWALEHLSRQLVAEERGSRYGVDVFSYHLGGRHR